MDRLFSAFLTQWNAQSLDSTVSGSLYWSEQPAATDYPHATMWSPTGNIKLFDDTQAAYREAEVQLDIWYKETGSTDPAGALGAMQRTVNAAFADQRFTVTGSRMLWCELIMDDIQRHDYDEGIWRGILSYKVQRCN